MSIDFACITFQGMFESGCLSWAGVGGAALGNDHFITFGSSGAREQRWMGPLSPALRHHAAELREFIGILL